MYQGEWRMLTTLSQNSTNILARNVTCHGGNGIAVGSLGQYVNLVSDARTNQQAAYHFG